MNANYRKSAQKAPSITKHQERTKYPGKKVLENFGTYSLPLVFGVTSILEIPPRTTRSKSSVHCTWFKINLLFTTSKPIILKEVPNGPNEYCNHHQCDGNESIRTLCIRKMHVHSIESRHEDGKERKNIDDGEDAHDGVRFVAQQRLMRFVQCITHFLGGFQQRPLALDGIQNVIEVDAEVGRNEFLVLVLQHGNERALRLDDAAHGDDVALHAENVAVHAGFGFTFEELLLHGAKSLLDGIHQRKPLVEELAHEFVEEIARSFLQVFQLLLLKIRDLLHHRGNERNLAAVDGDDEIRTQKDVHFFLHDAVVLAHVRNVKHQENVLFIFLDLRSLVLAEAVLYVKIVEMVALLQLAEFLLGRICVIAPTDSLMDDFRHKSGELPFFLARKIFASRIGGDDFRQHFVIAHAVPLRLEENKEEKGGAPQHPEKTHGEELDVFHAGNDEDKTDDAEPEE